MDEITPIKRRLIDTSVDISMNPADNIQYLHSVLAQVSLPRKKVTGAEFERTNGSASIKISAGELWDGKRWRLQEIPYGIKPRLTLLHCSSMAVKTNSPHINLGKSIRSFLDNLGIQTNGAQYTLFKKQMMALAGCRLSIGFVTKEGRAKTFDEKPISSFEAWLHPTGEQQTLWDGEITLSTDFFESLKEHCLPMDFRAISALRHSALAIDCYTYLSHRLQRINKPSVFLSWDILKDQFGVEYKNKADFKREFKSALLATMAVYPDAKVQPNNEGVTLFPSKPPIPKVAITVDKVWD